MEEAFTDRFPRGVDDVGWNFGDYQGLLEKELEKLNESNIEFDCRYAKAAANWMINPISQYLNRVKMDIEQFPVKPELLRALICYVEFTDLINFNTGNQVLEEMIKSPDEHPWDIMERLNLIQSNDEGEIEKLAGEIVGKFPEKATEYRKGKVGLLGFFTGELMRSTKTKINPKLANEILKKILDVV